MTPSGVTALRMKPNFALSLSFDGIRLLHRAGASGWHLVGEVALDCDDLNADLAALREKAAALDASGLSCKLIIPDEQIRYLDLPASSAPYGDYDAAAAEALDGATPYALEDLAFDWNVEGARLYVAAVARETLQEAESFATDHRFNPVSFVARPMGDGFGTEPFFGETSCAETPVERDAAPIEIIGAARMPEPEAVPDPVEEAADGLAHAPDAEEPPAPEPEGDAPEAAETAEADTGPEHEAEPRPEAESAVAFTSIRAERDAPATGAPILAGAARATPESRETTQVEGEATPGPAAASLAPTPDSGPDDAAAGDRGAIGFFSRRSRRAEPVPPTPMARAEPGFFGVEDDTPPVASTKGAGLAPPEDEADRMTIFGARSSQRGQRGKPRFLGVILTAALILLMVGVAAWATIFPDSGVGRLLRGAEPEIALTPEIPEIAAPASVSEAPETAVPEPRDTVVADPVPETTPRATLPEPEIALAPEPETSPEVAAEPEPVAGPLTPEEARARYAVTGIWQTPPAPPQEPEAGTIDDFYLTSIDEDVPMGDAVALPAVPEMAPDARPATPAAPAPPGTQFTLDARGFVVATPEGALTPDGVVVREGPPPVIPPDTPTRAVPVPGLTLTAEAAAELERLSGIRPRSRPGDLIEQQERGALGGRTRTELSDLRPRTRPEVIVQAAAAAVTPDPDAVAAALAEAVEDAASDATPQAVAASLKPRTRPGDFERIVREAPQQSAAAATVAPRIPSSASVARSATDRNAINMRQVNLIGVYGSPSNRRALVRLSNGRYQKVQVGDRMDGGRVSAIGDSELRYNKRGRDVVLRMPKG